MPGYPGLTRWGPTFSYLTEPDRVRGWFVEALQRAYVRDEEPEVVHQEGETAPLTHNVIAKNGSGQAGAPLRRCRED